jgi:hypothetical protein
MIDVEEYAQTLEKDLLQASVGSLGDGNPTRSRQDLADAWRR